MKEMMSRARSSPYRFFVVAAVLAALFSMLPNRADAPEREKRLDVPGEAQRADAEMQPPGGVPAGADLSERTQAGAFLHTTMTYACGHSVQRREALPAQLVGLTQAALDAQMSGALPGAKITGFGAGEVDVAQKLEIPCPLHWVLRLGENGRLEVLQNVSGEALSVVRETDVERNRLSENDMQELLSGISFDDVQALEGYVESLSS